ncbi:MAG: thioredoxin family protein [Sulfitobacter sp.]|nr:thioredoxin family protein [Sulfitobacter sp.]
MKRRSFLATSGAFALLPLAARAGFVDYPPGMIDAALKDGKTVFVDYSATWCSTCKRQERVIAELMAKNPAYAAAMTFVKVDWDTYAKDAVTTSRVIPRRSTLLVLKGNQELGRIVAGISVDQIKKLMDTGL